MSTVDEEKNIKTFQDFLDFCDITQPPLKGPKPSEEKLTFSKRLMVFACAIYTATWLTAVASWYFFGTIPDAIMGYGTFAFGVAITVYGAKSGYENHAKIENSFRSNIG